MIDLKSMSDDRLVQWLGVFADKIKGSASMLGISHSEVSSVEHDYRGMSSLTDAVNQAQSSNIDQRIRQDLDHYKNFIRNGPDDELRQKYPDAVKTAPGIIPRVTGMLDSIKSRSGYNPEIGRMLGIQGMGDASLSGMLESKSNPEIAAWLGGVVNGLKAHKSELDISDSEIEHINRDYESFREIADDSETVSRSDMPGAAADKLNRYMNMMKNGPGSSITALFPALGAMSIAPGIVPRISGLLDKLKDAPGFGAIAGSLGMGEPSPERYHETAAAGIGRGPEHPPPRSTQHAPGRSSSSSWLLPLIALGLIGLLAWLIWPRGGRDVDMGARIPETAGPDITAKQPAVPKPGIPAAPGAGPAKEAEALKISDISAMPVAKGAVVNWKTNRPSTSQIEFGKTESLEMGRGPRMADPDKMVIDHSMQIGGLMPKTRYYYRVISQDKAGNMAESRRYDFMTP